MGDKEYIQAFEERLRPTAEGFEPDFILISAGFDAHIDDPLAGMKVTDEGFGELTRIVKGIAKRYCDGRIVSALEGGYNLNALARSVERHLSILIEG
jgi:acetoin utilization deacetylase AcuC-like enzyme